MSPEQLLQAYREAQEALEAEKKRVSARRAARSLLRRERLRCPHTLCPCRPTCVVTRCCHPQAEEMRDKLLRTLADMENLRERTARTTAETKQFAVQVGAWVGWVGWLAAGAGQRTLQEMLPACWSLSAQSWQFTASRSATSILA